MFPDCQFGNVIPEIAHIVAQNPAGARYKRMAPVDYESLENLLVLCPSHHRLVDAEAGSFSVDTLRRWRESATGEIEVSFLYRSWARDESGVEAVASDSTGNEPAAPLPMPSAKRFKTLWDLNADNDDEAFWQNTFDEFPQLLRLSIQGNTVVIGDKCYVGGKRANNSGGKVTDFLYASPSRGDVVIVEIKTPTTPLVGGRYRTGVHSPSAELGGAIVQVLTQRSELLKNYYMLFHDAPDQNALNPSCVVVAGDSRHLEKDERASYALFTSALSGVTVLAYDDVFAKAEMIDE